jgi:hypothetical protein
MTMEVMLLETLFMVKASSTPVNTAWEGVGIDFNAKQNGELS